MSASPTPAAGLSPIMTASHEDSNDKSTDDHFFGIALAAAVEPLGVNQKAMQETVSVYENLEWNEDGLATHTTTKQVFQDADSGSSGSDEDVEVRTAETHLEQARLREMEVLAKAAKSSIEVSQAALLYARKRKLRKASAASNASHASGGSVNGSVRSRTSRRNEFSDRNSNHGSTPGGFGRRLVGADYRYDNFDPVKQQPGRLTPNGDSDFASVSDVAAPIDALPLTAKALLMLSRADHSTRTRGKVDTPGTPVKRSRHGPTARSESEPGHEPSVVPSVAASDDVNHFGPRRTRSKFGEATPGTPVTGTHADGG